MFAISLPLIYGEGRDKAFSRFQGMLIQQYDDDSILAWQEAVGPNTQRCWPILALSVKSFMHSGGIRYRSSLDGQQSLNRNRSQMDDSMRGFAVTNLGLRISRELLSCTNRNDISILKLQCYPVEDPEGFLGLSLWTEDNSRVPGPMVQTVQKGKNPIWKARLIDGVQHPVPYGSGETGGLVTMPPAICTKSLLLPCTTASVLEGRRSSEGLWLRWGGSKYVSNIWTTKVLELNVQGDQLFLPGLQMTTERQFLINPAEKLIIVLETKSENKILVEISSNASVRAMKVIQIFSIERMRVLEGRRGESTLGFQDFRLRAYVRPSLPSTFEQGLGDLTQFKTYTLGLLSSEERDATEARKREHALLESKQVYSLFQNDGMDESV
jgi:hypothetical protein